MSTLLTCVCIAVFMDSDSDEELRQLSAVVTRIRSYAGSVSIVLLML